MINDHMEILATRVRGLRRRLKLSQEALATDSDTTQGTIGRIETAAGSSVESDTLIKLAKFFNVSIDYLLGLTDNPGPPL